MEKLTLGEICRAAACRYSGPPQLLQQPVKDIVTDSRAVNSGMLFAAMLAGSAVSLCGLLGFVGLIAPHMAAGLLGTRDMRSLLPGSLLFGAMLTVVCELLARSMFSPYEIPVGIVLSYIGVPFFLFLLYRRGIRAGGE